MPQPKNGKKRQKSVVTGMTETQTDIAEAVLDGKTMAEAAAVAGCTPANASAAVKHSDDVKQYLEKHRSELSNALQIKRADVIAGFMEAIDTARLAVDPGSMIRGWTEIGKMLGLYAPERVEHTLSVGQRAIKSKYEIMPDDELLALIDGTVIDGECKTVQ